MKSSRILILSLALFGSHLALAQTETSASLPIMPLPASVTPGQGEFAIDGQFTVGFKGFTEPRLDRARNRFLNVLFAETGIPFSREAAPVGPRFEIEVKGPSETIEKLGEDESYQLAVTSDSVDRKSVV